MMKKGIIKLTQYVSYSQHDNDYSESYLAFVEGDEVEILKEEDNKGWLGDGYYVVFNPFTAEAMCIAKAFVDLVEEE